jgi:hypothetical protein
MQQLQDGNMKPVHHTGVYKVRRNQTVNVKGDQAVKLRRELDKSTHYVKLKSTVNVFFATGKTANVDRGSRLLLAGQPEIVPVNQGGNQPDTLAFLKESADGLVSVEELL